jgi:hypothetical protein
MKFAAVFIILSLAMLLLVGETESRPEGQVGMKCTWEGGRRVCTPGGNLNGWKELAKKTGKEAKRFGKRVKKWFG